MGRHESPTVSPPRGQWPCWAMLTAHLQRHIRLPDSCAVETTTQCIRGMIQEGQSIYFPKSSQRWLLLLGDPT